MSRTGEAVDDLLAAIADEERRRREQRPRMNTVDLGGLEYEAPPANRDEAGRRAHQAQHGGTYPEAFAAVCTDVVG